MAPSSSSSKLRALSLALLLTIVVLLLADLFCSQLRRRRQRADGEVSRRLPPKLGLASPAGTAMGADDAASVATTTREALSGTPPFYNAHGVMQAPDTKDLLLAIPKLEAAVWRWSPARARRSSPSANSSANSDCFVCISNPVYELGAAPAAAAAGGDTPFETPDASPSPFGITEEGEFSPPLSAMRKLPPLGVVACRPPVMGFVDGRPIGHR
ncbi:hypothetical protein GUJ93_ZPchr0004g38365 [Zizania palustris]|uniref:Uncharacterized protein n=1 Tax=Zizania palustris TaxID=103762 RepID=A0A8J5SE19_ZIZPA|nr:hypothetical protein GUJ93_ZPchr0004g38365 [Zizania palustris]